MEHSYEAKLPQEVRLFWETKDLSVNEHRILSKKHNRLGILFLNAKSYEKACAHFKKSIEYWHENANAYYNLSLAMIEGMGILTFEDAKSRRVEAINHLKIAIQLKPDFVAALSNLAGQLMILGDLNDSLVIVRKAISFNNNFPPAHFNLGTILRRLGRHHEAIEVCWKCICKDVGQDIVKEISFEDDTINIFDHLNIICVKWGTKYNFDYVNILFHGLKQHTTIPFTFHCLTDDSRGLLPEIQIICLSKGWIGWWNKAELFSPTLNLKGRNLYIDLDTVIVGSLDELLKFQGSFGILGTDDMKNEKRKNGFNSSLMLWQSGQYTILYTMLKQYSSIIFKYIYKFDHWIEMMMINKKCSILQELYPRQLVEYNSQCQEKLPIDSRIVCFPLKPKPHEALSPWVQEYWKLFPTYNDNH